MIKPRKVAIVGVGHVGSHVASALVTQGLVSELVLIDTDKAKAEAHGADLADTVCWMPHSARVWAGDYSDCGDAELMIIAASGPIFKEDRLEELAGSLDTMDEIAPHILSCGFQGLVMVITNPVDVVASYLRRKLNFGPNRVFGSGTTLDSGRLRRNIAQALGVSPMSVEAWVLGEHGDSQMIPWSRVTVGGQPLDMVPGGPELNRQDIWERTMKAGWSIVLGKGSTEFGIGAAAAQIVRAIFFDEKRILPVSVLLEDVCGQKGIHASVPVCLGASGPEKVCLPVLTEEEKQAFIRSCQRLKEFEPLLLNR